MKFDNHIVTYLYQQKVLSLAGMGEFTLDSSFKMQEDIDDNYFFPKEVINFQYNKKATTSTEFLEYLKQHFTKPITLIASDVEEYLLQVENFLNIGKSFTITGIGTLQKQQDGTIELFAGKTKVENIAAIVEALSKRETQFDILHNKPPTNDRQKIIKIVMAIFILLLIAVGTWLIIHFTKDTTEQNKTEKDTTETTQNIQIQNTPEPATATNSNNDTVRYKMFFLASKYKEKADNLFALRSRFDTINRDSVVINDTLRYRLFIYRKALPKDTAAVKKKLAAYFNHAITIEPAQ
ncbi:MAG: hypothetical protein KF781_10340 [Chitinophagaceae bacterium]|nr:hypothetical protein [Chitinophagaceae bacterium]MCW5904918.1 hypothetical protein [Chitinophagaceae bacterium]